MTEFLTDAEIDQRELDAERAAYDTEEQYQAWLDNERALDDDADAYFYDQEN